MEGETRDLFKESAPVGHALLRGDAMEENYMVSTTIPHPRPFHVEIFFPASDTREHILERAKLCTC